MSTPVLQPDKLLPLTDLTLMKRYAALMTGVCTYTLSEAPDCDILIWRGHVCLTCPVALSVQLLHCKMQQPQQ